MKVEWKSCFRVGISVLLLYLCVTYWTSFTGFAGALISASMPLLIGCVIAYIINIPMCFYEKHYFPKTNNSGIIKSRRPFCMLASFATLIFIVVLLINLVVPELVACVELLIAQLPGAVDSLLDWIGNMDIVPEDIFASISNVDWKSKIEQIISVLMTGVGNVMGIAISLVSAVFSGIVTALLAVIFAIYLLSGKEKLGRQFNKLMHRYMKNGLRTKITYVLSVMNESFHKYIVGQCTEAVILGILCAIGMLILRLPYASMIGALIAFTALIPVAGAYIGGGIGAFMIFTVSPIKAVIFVIFLVILQQLEGNLIYPRVVGSSMGLPAIWVLAAVTVGGGIMGIAGMLFSVPLAATLYRLLSEDVNKIKR